MKREEPSTESHVVQTSRTVVFRTSACASVRRPSPPDRGFARAGVSPLRRRNDVPATSSESGCLIMQPKVGGKLHLRLNTDTSPIANKYREGKLKRTLKREFNST